MSVGGFMIIDSDCRVRTRAVEATAIDTLESSAAERGTATAAPLSTAQSRAVNWTKRDGWRV